MLYVYNFIHTAHVLTADVPLLHKSPDGEPKAVGNGEVVLVDDASVDTGVRRGPLVGGEARHNPRRDGDQDVGEQNVEPDVEGQRIHEGEELKEHIYSSILLASLLEIFRCYDNTSAAGGLGALKRMLMPRFMKGLVKSITVSLA